MPGWVQWVTFCMAVVALGLSVFNTVTGYRRGLRRVQIRFRFKKPDGSELPRVVCKVVVPGSVPVTVAAVRMRLVHEGKTHETSIYGDPKVEARMVGELKPGTRRVAVAPAAYEPFFLRVRDFYVETECGKFARAHPLVIWYVKRKLRARLKQARLREAAEGRTTGQSVDTSRDPLTGQAIPKPPQIRHTRAPGID
jgi:hypothetical protein